MGKVAPVLWRNGTTILCVFHAGIVHRTIPATFVPFETPVFGPTLRLPKLRLFIDERTYARLGWLCNRAVLLGILPCPYLRGTKFLWLTSIRLLVKKCRPLPVTVLETRPNRRVRRPLAIVQVPQGVDLDLLWKFRNILPLYTMTGGMAPALA